MSIALRLFVTYLAFAGFLPAADLDEDGLDDALEAMLIDRHRPHLYYESRENDWPSSVLWFVLHSELTVGGDNDRQHDGKLMPCIRAYDTAAAGIISGANGLQPGMIMKAEGQPHAGSAHPVALTGRVWCLADAAHGGDRLTTSPTPGHAMRVSDASRAPGAVIGKAMTELESGTGLVFVLVNLQ
jgi:hypothetical protein